MKFFFASERTHFAVVHPEQQRQAQKNVFPWSAQTNTRKSCGSLSSFLIFMLKIRIRYSLQLFGVCDVLFFALCYGDLFIRTRETVKVEKHKINAEFFSLFFHRVLPTLLWLLLSVHLYRSQIFFLHLNFRFVDGGGADAAAAACNFYCCYLFGALCAGNKTNDFKFRV